MTYTRPMYGHLIDEDGGIPENGRKQPGNCEREQQEIARQTEGQLILGVTAWRGGSTSSPLLPSSPPPPNYTVGGHQHVENVTCAGERWIDPRSLRLFLRKGRGLNLMENMKRKEKIW